MTEMPMEEILARYNLARQVIGDMSIEKAAMTCRIGDLESQHAVAMRRAEELEAFIAKLQQEDAGADQTPDAISNGHRPAEKSAST